MLGSHKRHPDNDDSTSRGGDDSTWGDVDDTGEQVHRKKSQKEQRRQQGQQQGPQQPPEDDDANSTSIMPKKGRCGSIGKKFDKGKKDRVGVIPPRRAWLAFSMWFGSTVEYRYFLHHPSYVK